MRSILCVNSFQYEWCRLGIEQLFPFIHSFIHSFRWSRLVWHSFIQIVVDNKPQYSRSRPTIWVELLHTNSMSNFHLVLSFFYCCCSVLVIFFFIHQLISFLNFFCCKKFNHTCIISLWKREWSLKNFGM